MILKQKQQNISKAVYDLEKVGWIECLNPKKPAWKSYVITESGKRIFEYAKEQEKGAKKRKSY